jgi:hypothetical protein
MRLLFLAWTTAPPSPATWTSQPQPFPAGSSSSAAPYHLPQTCCEGACVLNEPCTSISRMVPREAPPTLIRDTVAYQNDCTTSSDLLGFAENCTYRKENTDTCKQSFCLWEGDLARSLFDESPDGTYGPPGQSPRSIPESA